MTGGLLQIVSYGLQDTYLTGNPQKTFFKSVYKRHTNFSIESIAQQISGEFSFEQRISVKIDRNGDLLSKCFIEFTVENNSGSDNLFKMLTNNGYAFIDYIELEIGGQIFDKQYGEWMNIWSELTLTYDKLNVLRRMIDPRKYISDSEHKMSKTFYIPLNFWFCRHFGSALPLIALQYHDVVFHIKLNKAEKVLSNDDFQDTNCCKKIVIKDCKLYWQCPMCS